MVASRKNRNRNRRQRGGFTESLQQGEMYAKMNPMNRPMTQHGGSRDALVGAPLDHTGVLDSSMRAAARLETYDRHFMDAQAQKGGRRSRSRSRKQRGGNMSPAPVEQPYLLLEKYDGTGGGSPANPPTVAQHPMKGGRRQSRRRQSKQSRKSKQSRQSKQSKQSRQSRQSRQSKQSKQSRQSRQSRQSKQSRRRQRGGYSPVGAPTMLLSDYSKAGLSADFADPLVLK